MPHWNARPLALMGSVSALTCALALGTAAPTRQAEPVEAAAPATSLALPGAKHAQLEPLIGTWTLRGRYRAAPGAEWEAFEARAEREWTLGGRFVAERVTSEWNGEPFEAASFLGYDNVRAEFVQVWLENTSTGVQSSTGQMDGDGLTLTLEGRNSNALTGERDVWHRSVVSMVEADRTVYAGFGRDAEGREFQNLEMIADRE